MIGETELAQLVADLLEAACRLHAANLLQQSARLTERYNLMIDLEQHLARVLHCDHAAVNSLTKALYEARELFDNDDEAATYAKLQTGILFSDLPTTTQERLASAIQQALLR